MSCKCMIINRIIRSICKNKFSKHKSYPCIQVKIEGPFPPDSMYRVVAVREKRDSRFRENSQLANYVVLGSQRGIYRPLQRNLSGCELHVLIVHISGIIKRNALFQHASCRGISSKIFILYKVPPDL